MPIDFKTKRTEEEWRLLALENIPVATKMWFEWAEWAVIMGALLYVYDRSKNWAVSIVLVVSIVMFTVYFTGLFANLITYKSFPFIKSDRASFWLAVILSVALTAGATIVLRTVVAELSTHKE